MKAMDEKAAAFKNVGGFFILLVEYDKNITTKIFGKKGFFNPFLCKIPLVDS